MGLAHSRDASPRSSSTSSVVPSNNPSSTSQGTTNTTNDTNIRSNSSTSQVDLSSVSSSPNTPKPNSSTSLPNGSPSSSSKQDGFLVAKVFTWNFGGTSVYIAGAWDQWTTRTPMYKNGTEHIALLYVPCGEFQFKYLVDDTWQCAPDLPTRVDEHGNTNNIIQIETPAPDFDVVGLIHQPPPLSPLSSYDQGANGEFTIDPPTIPPHLEACTLKPLPDDICPGVGNAITSSTNSDSISNPNSIVNHDHTSNVTHTSSTRERPFFSHVFIDHLYLEKGPGLAAEHDVRCFSQISRISGKVVNTVLVMKKIPRDGSNMESNGYNHDSLCGPTGSP